MLDEYIREYTIFRPNSYKHIISCKCDINKSIYGVIYRLLSPEGKSYIGLTTTYDKRMDKYKRYDCKEQIGIYNALRLYGVENFEFQILGNCYNKEMEKLSENALNKLEIFFVYFYKSLARMGCGYNIREPGGSRGKMF